MHTALYHDDWVQYIDYLMLLISCDINSEITNLSPIQKQHDYNHLDFPASAPITSVVRMQQNSVPVYNKTRDWVKESHQQSSPLTMPPYLLPQRVAVPANSYIPQA